MTEDLITILSKIPELLVIARTSTFTYKARPADARQAASELGVRYVLEGSVRVVGGKVRINAQLIDANSGAHVWAERYDGSLDDVLGLQDDITEEIAAALEAEVGGGEQRRDWRRQAGSRKAYDHFSRGRDLYMRFSRSSNAQAKKHLKRAIAVNPRFSFAYSVLGFCYCEDARFGWTDDFESALSKAREMAAQAIEIDPSDCVAQCVLSYAAVLDRSADVNERIGVAAAEKAIAASPSASDPYHFLAMAHIYMGNPAEAARLEQRAIHLSPLAPENSLVELGRAYFHLGRYDDAIAVLERAKARKSNWLTIRTVLAACYAEAGNDAAAAEERAEILRLSPRFTLAYWAQLQMYRREDDLGKLIDALRRAGLPDD